MQSLQKKAVHQPELVSILTMAQLVPFLILPLRLINCGRFLQLLPRHFALLVAELTDIFISYFAYLHYHSVQRYKSYQNHF